MHHPRCHKDLRTCHNGPAIKRTIHMLLLTPVMIHPGINFMLIMLMLDAEIIGTLSFDILLCTRSR